VTGVEPVQSVRTPVRLAYEYSAGMATSRFLRGLEQGKVFAQRCPTCTKVYVPPRGSCPTCAVPTKEEIELGHTGVVTTFCVVNIPFLGQQIEIPYVTSSILLDGADIPLFHLIQEVPVDQVRMGMRVEAVWAPREEWGPSLTNIRYFRPTGEPDAPFESYKDHL
jgi:uncharacterized OB-fold protein